jgi:phosphatidylserine/phosphatidylglycerophosphate/cardiolipin synthase-like enzyme
MTRLSRILCLIGLLLPGCAAESRITIENYGTVNVTGIDLAAPAAATGRADSQTPATAERADAARPGMTAPAGPATLSTTRPAEVECLFSPHGGCQASIVAELGKAKTNVMLSMYLLTNPAITDALIAALHRGSIVNVVMDGKEMASNLTAATALTKGGVAVWLNTKYAIFHEKLCIIDGYTVIAGSYNWTLTAENANAEDLFIIKNKTVAATCARNFGQHQAESKLFVPTSQPAKE